MTAKPFPAAQARQRGAAARDAGMELAAQRKMWFVRRDTLRFLDAMMAHHDRTATTDDATGELDETFSDGGKWRGSVPKALARDGLIAKSGVVLSDRPARHRGYLALWRAVDLDGIVQKREELRRWLAEHPCPAEPVGDTLFDGLVGESGVGHAR